MLNTDIQPDKAATPCQRDLKYWFGCRVWHKEKRTSDEWDVCWSSLCFLQQPGYWMFVFDAFFSTQTSPASLVTARTNGKMKVSNSFPITLLLLSFPGIHKGSISSLWQTHNTRKWCVLFITDLFTFKPALHFSLWTLSHILPSTDFLSLGGHK